METSAGALSETRREQLEEIDASWCPSWPVTWQRAFHLVRMHLDAGAALPTEAGDVVRQGEDLGRWVQSVRYGWDELTAVQQWMCEQVLGIEPASEDEKPKRRTQADKWALNYEAAKQFYAREGHLQVPRKHVERIAGGEPVQGEEAI
ncbi:helicase associated domain-containing protein [Streptomyces sp. NPDC018038]|uniref:helicase associated domain-containing protein n=1 Tax=Streptomyces sp. NPDC018038 TaxID=3365036 RepID=UPI0037B8A5A4